MMPTEAEIRTWIGGYPREWEGLCQALMWQLCDRFGRTVSTPGSALDAYRVEADAGRIRGGTPPPGTFVYWDIGAYGHVGFMLNGGRIFMASTHTFEEWTNDDAGPQYLDAYDAETGAIYLGWSDQNAGNVCPFTADGSPDTGKGTRVMHHYHYQDRTATSVKPGGMTWLRNNAAGKDQNIVGGVGDYSITVHVYAAGLDPSDSLNIALVWESANDPVPSDGASAHYTETVRANRDGQINANVEFKRAVVPGDMVFVRVSAPSTNERSASVTLIDSDAYLFG